jgi:RNA polymerase sigma factor (TIGR02999 family)
MSSSRIALTLLMQAAASGDRTAANDLFSLVYDELRRLAGGQMKLESRQTLQSTALVHEVWLKLIGNQAAPEWKSRTHFFSAAAQAMRRILVDAARTRKRIKRGGDNQQFEIRDDDLISDNDEELLALDEALELLRAHDPVKADLVSLRFFAGLTNKQAAEQLDISTATAERYWAYSKAWLRARMDS